MPTPESTPAEPQPGGGPAEHNEISAPVEPPIDAEEEKQRLLADARALGVDEEAALDLAERAAHSGSSAPEAYRFVDRRIAAGYTIDDAEAILVGDSEPAADDPNAESTGD